MTPAAPNPQQTATAQSGANRDSAIAGALVNNVDQVTPFGNVSYTQDGFNTYTDASGQEVKIPKFTSTQTLSPEQQALYQKQTEAGSNLGDLAVSQSANLNTTLNQPFNPDLGPNDFSTDRANVRDQILSRFNEDFSRDNAALETKLVNQGLAPGSEAWNDAVALQGRQQTDARVQADLAAGQEQSRLSGLRSNALQEQIAVRNQPINEISALMSGGQVTVPQFSAPFQQGVGATDVAGIIGDDYARRQQQANAFNSGAFGLGSSALTGLFALSDERAKKDIKEVGTTKAGLPIYTYKYKPELGMGDKTIMGVMAHEVEQVSPDAVATTQSGLKAVDYRKVA